MDRHGQLCAKADQDLRVGLGSIYGRGGSLSDDLCQGMDAKSQIGTPPCDNWIRTCEPIESDFRLSIYVGSSVRGPLWQPD